MMFQNKNTNMNKKLIIEIQNIFIFFYGKLWYIVELDAISCSRSPNIYMFNGLSEKKHKILLILAGISFS